jgi:hypothetical protein
MILFHRKHFGRRYPPPINAMTYTGIGIRFTALVIQHYVKKLLLAGRTTMPRLSMQRAGDPPVPAGGDVVV